MNRRAFLLAGGTALSCARDRRPRLNVYNWSSYIDPESIARFEREHGIRIRYGTYESNEEMLAKIVGGNSGWDIVFPTHSRLEPMARNGLIATLNHALLPSLGNLSARFRRPPWDPDLKWGVPYMWNATGIVYNKRQVPEPRRWDALWSPALSGRLTMLDDPEDVIGACLQKLGFPFSSSDETQLRAARGEAIRQKTLLRAYINAEVRDQLVAGDVLAAQLWSTTSSQAMQASSDLGFAYPTEGYPLYCDCAVILQESVRQELAHRFLDFLMRNDVAGANAHAADTASPNMEVENANRNNEVLYPAPTVAQRGIWPIPLTQKCQRFRDQIWTQIKSY